MSALMTTRRPRTPPLKRGLPPLHPGAILKRTILPALKAEGVPRTKVADDLGIGRRTLYDVLDELRPVTPELALKLGRYFGNEPQFWMNLQTTWDLHQARERLGADLEAVPVLERPRTAA